MSLALERVLAPAPGFPAPPAIEDTESRLNVAVVFTSVEATLAALRKAGALANRLSGRITLLVPQVVPYPLPLNSPPVLLDWNEKRFRVIASESPGRDHRPDIPVPRSTGDADGRAESPLACRRRWSANDGGRQPKNVWRESCVAPDTK